MKSRHSTLTICDSLRSVNDSFSKNPHLYALHCIPIGTEQYSECIQRVLWQKQPGLKLVANCWFTRYDIFSEIVHIFLSCLVPYCRECMHFILTALGWWQNCSLLSAAGYIKIIYYTDNWWEQEQYRNICWKRNTLHCLRKHFIISTSTSKCKII